MGMTGEQSPTCPYADRPCPKVTDMENDLRATKRTLDEVRALLYVIVGIMAVQLGVNLL